MTDESTLERLRVSDMPFTIRMNGCPNGCVEGLLSDWAKRRELEEGFGDFYDRLLRESERRDILSGAKTERAVRATGPSGSSRA